MVDFKDQNFWLLAGVFVALGIFVGYLAGGVSTTGNVIYQNSCFDSDGGKNVRAFGYSVSGGDRFFDYCEGSTLVEQYCNRGFPDVYPQKCSNGCEAGRCLD